jgi:hypothetical protein
VDDVYIVNKQYTLVFFHFSGYNINVPTQLSRHQNRFNIALLPAFEQLISVYYQALVQNGHDRLSKFPCAYGKLSGLKWYWRKKMKMVK